ncbi:MAG: tetratricopeptide repeat protein [Pseudomonadota bacterium]
MSNSEELPPTESPQHSGQNWLARIRSRLRIAFTRKGAGIVLKACLVGVSRAGWAAAGIVILAAFVHSMTSEIISVDTISVPRIFSDSGFSSDVASQRLRDALTRFAQRTGSRMQSPFVSLTSELPKITVPKVDVSLDTVTTLIRKLFHIGNTRNISGEFVLQGDTVWLRLRKDGQEIFTGTTTGFDPSKLDRLLDVAAPSIVREIRPYLIASAAYNDNPDGAFEMTEDIITRLPSSDINVAWSLVLQGKYYLDRNKPDLAEPRLRKAIYLNSSIPAAHFGLAIALEKQGKKDGAIAEYRLTIELQQSDALARNNLGVLLQDQKQIDAAITEYRRAIAWDPFYAPAHNNLGSALKEKGQVQEAIMRYRRAIDIDQTYTRARYNLGVILKELGKSDEAIAEFRRAIEDSPNDVPSRIGLARTLLDLRKLDEALKEYELVLRIEPNNKLARGDIEQLRDFAPDGNSKR